MEAPLFARLNIQLAHLFDLTRGMNSEFIHKNHIENKWSIHEHLAHLGRYQEIFLGRIKLILENDNPKIERYKAENDPRFEDWKKLSLKDFRFEMKARRSQLTSTIFGLTIPELNRIGSHPKFRKMNIYEWTEFFMLHESHHAYAIFRIKKEFSKET